MPASRRALPLSLTVVAALAACSTGNDVASAPTSTGSPSSSTTSATSPTTPQATSSTPAGTAPASPTSAPAADPMARCAQQAYAALSPDQRIGQLIMVGLDTNASASSLDSQINDLHVGNVILLGGWQGAAKVRSATTHLQAQAGPNATKGIKLLMAADQEGGEVRQLRGNGFSMIPSAHAQDAMNPAQLTAASTPWAKELAAVGINLNLAPVADTVPASLGAGNAPIGKYGREFSSDPADNARMVPAFIAGMHAGGVAATVKHFPGLGRIRNNTDFSSTGITDSQTSANDPYLQPFSAGIAAGADLVMMSSARYTKLDANNQALFSKAIVTDLLRNTLGWKGVVITDDVGNAAAVRAVGVGSRATKFIDAGGDIVLTGNPANSAPMVAALKKSSATNPAFATKVEASVLRVLELKAKRGLIPNCS